MSPASSSGSINKPGSPTRRSHTKKSTIRVMAVSGEEVERRILEVLKKHAAMKGLTNSELLKKCGSITKRSLAIFFKRKEPTAEDLKGLLYEIWRKGLLFFEPPNRGQRVGRVWDIGSARNVFSLACTPARARNGSTEAPEGSQRALRAAYDKFVPEHLGGFVPIFKVRRELGWSSEAFDALLQDLNEQNDPVLELHAADPADLTEGERRDSLWQGGRLLVRMRWREP